jgi:hypothetical protein
MMVKSMGRERRRERRERIVMKKYSKEHQGSNTTLTYATLNPAIVVSMLDCRHVYEYNIPLHWNKNHKEVTNLDWQ